MKMLYRLLCISLILIAIGGCNGQEDNALDFRNYSEPYPEGGHMQGEYGPMDNISSESTNIPSSEFPHTKAVQVQQAKYEFDVDPDQLHPDDLYDLVEDELNTQLDRWQEGQPGQRQQPEQRQPGTAPAPDQQQPDQQQPDQQQPDQQPAQPEPEEAEPVAPEQEQDEEPQQEEEQEADPGHGLNESERRVIELTNAERRNHNLPELETHNQLSNVARVKSEDMQEDNYFSHTSPTYGSPFDMIRDFDVDYSAAAENIAQGQQSPEQVVESWMNSEGHRQNILNGDFTHIGVGYEENGNYWTQMFISE
ncbi:CAP domain-containing protein [Bacillus shivajii]|uniref:CAP domain-containing protein n=1 Tax=Bacillus shivajii TaxID=1983719 RepID=UPI001CF94F6B|nr:CAP domain-containing protein [Bacillus shivajii]UCZ51394.1 CAP domain-containing protein [Bacillus shivajii]